MSVANPVVGSWDGLNRRIYLLQGVTDFNWLDDIYIEYRRERRLTESFRKWNAFMVASGNVPKGGGKATPRLLTLLEGAKVIAWDENIEITITGEAITDDADNDPTLFDNSTRTNPLILNYQPPAAEVIVVDAIQQTLDYGGVLSYDENSANTGQDHPIGTPGFPVNNITDGLVLAAKFSLRIIDTSSDVNLDQDVSGFNIRSVFHTLTFYSAGFKAHESSIMNMIIDGDFNNSNLFIENCIVDKALNIYGKIKDSYLGGDGAANKILISANQKLSIVDSESDISGNNSPKVDMNVGQTTELSVRALSGGFTVENCDTPGCISSLAFISGKCHLLATNTDGLISIRGNALMDDLSNGTVVDVSALLNQDTISYSVWERHLAQHTTEGTAGHILDQTKYLKRSVYVDPELVVNGDGSSGSPFNNIGDAIDFAEAHSLRELIALTEITIDRNLKNFIITGIGTPVINCGGFDLKGSEFRHCTMRGVYVDAITVQECVLDNGFYLNGFFENCAISGTITCVDGSNVLLKDCSGLTDQIISMNGAGSSNLIISGHSGNLTIKDSNNALDNLNIGMSEGIVTIDATCTDGNITVTGNSKLINNSAILGFDSSALVQPQDLIDVLKLTGNKVTKSGDIITIYEKDGTTVWKQIDLSNGGRVDV